MSTTRAPFGDVTAPIGTSSATNQIEQSEEITRMLDLAEKFHQHDKEREALFKQVIWRNADLTQQLRHMHEAAMPSQREHALQQRLLSYEHLAARDPYVLILINGDSILFQDDLIADGENGGQRAATQLRFEVIEYMCAKKEVPFDFRIVCHVYANVKGVAQTLVDSGVVPCVKRFEQFVQGFTAGPKYFDFIDVGPGKDIADKKLLDNLELYSNNLHCHQIFFGYSDLNGFARVLNSADYVEKITLVEGVPFKKEPAALEYRSLSCPRIFRDSVPAPGKYSNTTGHGMKAFKNDGGHQLPLRLAPSSQNNHRLNGEKSSLNSPTTGNMNVPVSRTPSSSTIASDGTPQAMKQMLPMNYAAKAAAPAPTEEKKTVSSPKPVQSKGDILRNRLGQRLDPPTPGYEKQEVDRVKKIKMCNVHFLRNQCPFRTNCTHVHKYNPTKRELETLRLVARMAPCQYGLACEDAQCIYGHRCPAPRAPGAQSGTRSCIFGEKCKFPVELHDVDCKVADLVVVR